jgi:hypothetical protein
MIDMLGVGQRVGDVFLGEDNPGDVRSAKEMFEEAGLDVTYHISTTRRDAPDFLRQRGAHADAPRSNVIFLNRCVDDRGRLAETRRIDGVETVPVSC